MGKPRRAEALKLISLDREFLLDALNECQRRKLHNTGGQSSSGFDEAMNKRLCEIIAEWQLSDLNHQANTFLHRRNRSNWKKGVQPKPQALVVLCAFYELTGYDVSDGLVVSRGKALNNYGFSELEGVSATRVLNQPFSQRADVYDVFVGQVRLGVVTDQIGPDCLPNDWLRHEYVDQEEPVGSYSISIPRAFIEVDGFDPSIVKDFMLDDAVEEDDDSGELAEDVVRVRRDDLRKDLVYAINLQPGVQKTDQGFCDGGLLAWRLAVKQWEFKAIEGEYPLAAANEVKLCRISALTGSYADLTVWAEIEEVVPRVHLNRKVIKEPGPDNPIKERVDLTRIKILEQVLKQRHIESDRLKLSSARLFFE